MTRLLLAIRVFFRVLFNGDVANRVAAALIAGPSTAATTPAATGAAAAAPRPKTAPPARSEALTLLATLQREARFVDFVQEPLGGYSDAQIGAAARDVHRLCAEVIDRVFGLRPVVDAAEGSDVDVPGGAAATRFHLVGNVGAPAPRRGKLCHKGWEATHCQLPQWTGDDDARLIVAPAEVELR
jgi:hypothetical protein